LEWLPEADPEGEGEEEKASEIRTEPIVQVIPVARRIVGRAKKVES
jgi:hypothetical protein